MQQKRVTPTAQWCYNWLSHADGIDNGTQVFVAGVTEYISQWKIHPHLRHMGVDLHLHMQLPSS